MLLSVGGGDASIGLAVGASVELVVAALGLVLGTNVVEPIDGA